MGVFKISSFFLIFAIFVIGCGGYDVNDEADEAARMLMLRDVIQLDQSAAMMMMPLFMQPEFTYRFPERHAGSDNEALRPFAVDPSDPRFYAQPQAFIDNLDLNYRQNEEDKNNQFKPDIERSNYRENYSGVNINPSQYDNQNRGYDTGTEKEEDMKSKFDPDDRYIEGFKQGLLHKDRLIQNERFKQHLFNHYNGLKQNKNGFEELNPVANEQIRENIEWTPDITNKERENMMNRIPYNAIMGKTNIKDLNEENAALFNSVNNNPNTINMAKDYNNFDGKKSEGLNMRRENTLLDAEMNGNKELDDTSVRNKRMDDATLGVYVIAAVAGASAAAAVAVSALALSWYNLHRRNKEAAECEYPAYGVTGPRRDIHSSMQTSASGGTPVGSALMHPGAAAATTGSAVDRGLARSAHMYHYQHQKQQIIAMEAGGPAGHCSGSISDIERSDDEEDEEGEEGDYTVYECPGLAPAGEMEVKNPLFDDLESTPGLRNEAGLDLK